MAKKMQQKTQQDSLPLNNNRKNRRKSRGHSVSSSESIGKSAQEQQVLTLTSPAPERGGENVEKEYPEDGMDMSEVDEESEYHENESGKRLIANNEVLAQNNRRINMPGLYHTEVCFVSLFNPCVLLR